MGRAARLGWPHLLPLSVLALGAAAPPASAQATTPGRGLVVRDDTLGSGRGEVVSPGTDPLGKPATYLITPELGEQHGGNLFHSFKTFGIGKGETATFTGPDPVDGPQSVSNVISRVTGGDPSEIDGTLRTTIPGADVWLLNPSGVVFGEGAQLDVPGSFHASTADSVGFEGGLERFYVDGRPSSVLSMARPEAFGFLGERPAAPISVSGATLETQRTGDTLSLVGGDVLLDGARVTAKNGRVNLAAAASAGEVVLAPADANEPLEMRGFGALGEVGLQARDGVGALVDVGGEAPGQVFIRGGQLLVQGGEAAGEARSRVLAQNEGAGGGGSISVETSDSVDVNHGLLSVSTHAAGDAGTIAITGGDVEFRNGPGTWTFWPPEAVQTPFEIAVGASAETTAAGAGGTLRIDANSLSVADGAVLGAGSIGAGASGDAGAVEVSAASVDVARRGVILVSSGWSRGDAGRVSLDVDTLTIDGAGGGLTGIHAVATSLGSGALPTAPGTIEITANGQVTLRNAGNILNWCELCTTRLEERPPDAGLVRIQAGSMLVESAEVAMGTALEESGDASRIEVSGGKLELRHGASVHVSNFGGGGHAGSVTIHVGELDIDDGFLAAETEGWGDAGAITIHAGSVVIGSGAITSQTTGTGDAGDIQLDVDSLVIRDGGRISAKTTGPGNAGDIKLGDDDAPVCSLVIEGRGVISAETSSQGTAGNIDLYADSLVMRDGARISTKTTGAGNAGNIKLGDDGAPAGSLVIERGGVISAETSTSATAGNIDLDADSLVMRDGGRISTSATWLGNAGDVFVDAESLVIEGGGVISSSTARWGEGGVIDLRGDQIRIAKGGLVTTTSEGLPRYGLVFSRNGDAGHVVLAATGLIELGGAVSSASGGPGLAGDVTLHAPRIFVFDGGTVTTNANHADGGNIAILAQKLVHLDDGVITSSVSGETGGNITIDPTVVILENGSQVVATATTGHGGDIQISTDNLFAFPDSVVSAKSGNQALSGTVEIHSPDVNLAGTLAELPSNFLDAASQMKTRCAARKSGERVGSFSVRGPGGLPAEPDGWLPAPLLPDDWTDTAMAADSSLLVARLSGPLLLHPGCL